MDAVDQLGAALKTLTAHEDDAARRRAALETELATAGRTKDAAYKTAWTKATQAGWSAAELRKIGFPNPAPAARKPRQPTPPVTPTQPNHAAINPDPQPVDDQPTNNTWA